MPSCLRGCLYLLAALLIAQITFLCFRQPQSNAAVSKHKTVEECGRCEGGESACYPIDARKCGECLPCAVKKAEFKPVDGTALAVSARVGIVHVLLVLIASIHKHLPGTTLLVYNEAEEPSLQRQLVSIRHVVVVNPSDVSDSIARLPGQRTPAFIKDSLTRFRRVAWLSASTELTSDVFSLELTRPTTADAVFLGRTDIKQHSHLGFRAFFPLSASGFKNYTAAIYSQRSRPLIEWLSRCADSNECWRCADESGFQVDCTPFLLSHLAQKFNYEVRRLAGVETQAWSPPECDWKCATVVVVSVIAFITLFVACVLYTYDKRPRPKTK